MANDFGLNFGKINEVDYKATNKNGFQANSNMVDPAYLADGSTNLFFNNRNLDPVMVNETISNVFLETLKSENDDKYLQFASKHHTIEKGKGTNKFSIPRWRTMTLNTAPMKEAEVPKPLTISLEKVSVTCSSYGDWVQITDQMLLHSPVNVLSELSKQLAETMRLKLNIIMREIMYLGATQAFVGETATAEAAGKKGTRAVTIDDLSMIVKQMKDDKVKGHTSGKYYILGGTDLIMSLSKDPNVHQFAINQSMQPVNLAPWDSKLVYGDLVIIEVTEPKKVKGTAHDTEVAFILGENAYVTVGIPGLEGITMIHKELGSAGTADPFNQIASLSVRIEAFGGAVLNPNAIYALHFPSVRNAVGAEASGDAGKALYNEAKIVLKDGQTMHTLLGSDEQSMETIWNGDSVYPRPIESHKDYMDKVKGKEVFIKSPLDSLKEDDEDGGTTPKK